MCWIAENTSPLPADSSSCDHYTHRTTLSLCSDSTHGGFNILKWQYIISALLSGVFSRCQKQGFTAGCVTVWSRWWSTADQDGKAAHLCGDDCVQKVPHSLHGLRGRSGAPVLWAAEAGAGGAGPAGSRLLLWLASKRHQSVPWNTRQNQGKNVIRPRQHCMFFPGPLISYSIMAFGSELCILHESLCEARSSFGFTRQQQREEVEK